MVSEIRELVFQSMDHYREILNPDNKGWKVLEVGIAGDPKPGGNYKNFGQGNDYVTMDFESIYEPDIVADICENSLRGGQWDLIIISQTLEHVKYPKKAVEECYRLLKSNGLLIADCPFYWPYHAEPEFGDYWRLSDTGLNILLEDAGFVVKELALLRGILATSLTQKVYGFDHHCDV